MIYDANESENLDNTVAESKFRRKNVYIIEMCVKKEKKGKTLC